MKPKEIIEKANLHKGFDKKRQEVFFGTMVDELLAVYGSFGVKDSDRHFDVAVKSLRAKWDAISNKIPYGLSDGVWGFFYARYVGPLKGELCPTWKARNDAWQLKKEERHKRAEEKRNKNVEEWLWQED